MQAFASDDVVALDEADDGRSIHWDGTAWSVMSAFSPVQVESFWGRSAQELYVVQADYQDFMSSIYAWDGSALTTVDSVDFDFRTITADASSLFLEVRIWTAMSGASGSAPTAPGRCCRRSMSSDWSVPAMA